MVAPKQGGARGRKSQGYPTSGPQKRDYRSDRSAFSCAVRNLSESGASLDVPSSVGIPHEFQLIIQAE